MRAHAALFASLFGVTLVISALGVGIGGYLSATAVSGVREGLVTATGTEGAVRIEIRRAADPAAQDSAVRQVVGAGFTAPIVIDRTVQGTVDGVIVASVDDLASHVELVEGRWPESSGEASMQADAAAALDLTPGDTVPIAGGPTVTLSATWRALDPLDAFWFGDPAVSTGENLDGIGPLVVDESVWNEIDSSPFARWTVRADTGSVVPADLADLATAPGRLQAALAEQPAVGTTGIVFGGDLAATATALRASIDAVGGVAPVALLLIAAIAVVSLSELGRLLVGVRTGETALLRSRGASATWVARTTVAETAVVSVPAATLGSAIGIAVTLVSAGRLPDAALAVAVPAIVAAAAIALAAWAAGSSARRAFRRDTANDSGRARRVAGLGLTVIVVAAAIFAVWQFRLYGSPLVRSASGILIADPVAVLATPLALLAAAVTALALFPVVAAAGERLVARGRSIAVLPAWQLSRRVTVFATPVVIVALATGGITVAAAYSATWSGATDATREVRNGGDVRVVLPPGTSFDASAVRDASSSITALTAATVLGDDPVDLVAYNTSGATAGIAVPSGATAIALDSTVDTTSSGVQTSIWLIDSDERLYNVAVVDGVAQVPALAKRPAIIAIDVRPTSADAGTAVGFMLSGLRAVTADGEEHPIPVPADWVRVDTLPFDGEFLEAAEPLSARVTVTGALPGVIRFMASSDDSAVGDAVGLAVSESLAARADLHPGDPLTLGFAGSGRTLTATVDSVTPVVRGMSGDFAALADLAAFDVQQLHHYDTVPDATERWFTAADPAAAARSVRALVGDSPRITTTEPEAENTLLGSARVALWWGSLGALLLAVVSVSAVAGALLRARSAEVVVLRAIGMTGRQQARGRRRELAALLGFSLAAGAIGGAVVSGLTVAGLARSTVLDPIAALPTPVSVDGVGLAGALALVILSLGIVSVAYSRRVGRQADTLSAREEVR